MGSQSGHKCLAEQPGEDGELGDWEGVQVG